jgi:hypothetical protein
MPEEIAMNKKIMKGLLVFLTLDLMLLTYLSVKGPDEVCGKWFKPHDATCETSYGSSYSCQKRDCEYMVSNPDARDWLLRRRYK